MHTRATKLMRLITVALSLLYWPTVAQGTPPCAPAGTTQEQACQNRCPTYDFAPSMFQNGAHYTDTMDCPLCLSNTSISLNPSQSQYIDLGTTTVGGNLTAM
eukprot:2195313-Rhodomonas_salina.1